MSEHYELSHSELNEKRLAAEAQRNRLLEAGSQLADLLADTSPFTINRLWYVRQERALEAWNLAASHPEGGER